MQRAQRFEARKRSSVQVQLPWARIARARAAGVLAAVALAWATNAFAAPTFLAFESGPVRPMAFSPDRSTLYAVNTPDGQLEVFAVGVSGLTFVRSIPVGQEPVAVAVRSASEVWVVNHLSDSVSVVDPVAGVVRRTLLVGDEPRDILFAGPGSARAFITTAHRGQHRSDPSIAAVPGAGDPQLTTEGIGRADIWVFDAANLGVSLGGTPLRIVTVFGDTPRALARSVDGTKVWVAVHHSGNRTTAIQNAFVCDGFLQSTACVVAGLVNSPGGVPGPARNVEGFAAPEVGLIAQQGSDGQWRDVLGRLWNAGPLIGPHVRFNLPDLDVFELDTTTLVQTRAHAGVGTTLFNMAVNPDSGKLYISNSDSKNLTQFEGPGITGGSTVQGHLAESRITVIDGTSVLPRHLNKHLDYGVLAGEPRFDPTARDHSLASPLEMAVSGDGATLYVTAFGSSRVGVIPTAALESNSFDPELLSGGYIEVTGGGPAGLLLDEPNDRLFVYTRFDNGLSMIDLSTRRELAHWRFPNQEPLAVVEGRPFLYDARSGSGNGEASCASCHTFGDMDQLGWDLGNPDDVMTSNPMAIPFPGPVPTPAGLNGVGVLDVFHPMKGPMTTQTLRGMQHGGAMHWRGDRSNGFFGASPDDEDLAFRNFIVAFEGLLGRETPLSDVDMQRFADFALSLVLPPNPIRRLDNQLTPSASRGRNFFLNTPTDATLTCENCHRLDASQGFFGGGTFSTFEGNSQIFKVPHLRNMYAKVGMFGFLAPFGGGTVQTGDQVRGFGFSHDGAVDTLFRFVSAPAFVFPSDAERRDSEAFMLQFDNDIAPIVGQQVTLTTTNAAVVGPRIDLLVARAAAPFSSLLLDGATTECELVVKGVIGGEPRGWVRLANGLFHRDDDPGQSALVSDAALRAQVASVGPLTYTCVAPGSGTRVGINRDLDLRLDALDNCPGNVNDDQADFDQDGLGDPCDPTPLPEPGLAAGVGVGIFCVAAAGRRRRGVRGSHD